MSEMKWQSLSVDVLHPAAYNPRKKLKAGDKEYEKIKNSILEFGYVEPIIVNYDMTVIGGHQRLTVLKDLGYTEVQCVVVEIADENKVKALNIALNKIAGAWDENMLADLLADLKSVDFNTDFTGFEPPEIDQIMTRVHDKNSKEDDFDVDAALEEETFVKPGDVWHLGKHRMMCGDATKAEDVAILMNGKKANLAVTDPPYNCSYEGGTGMTIMNDNMESEQFYAFLFAAMKNAYNHLADGGAIYVFHSDAEKVNFYNATVNAGFHYSTTCIWVKNSLVLGRMDYQMRHEPIIYAFKDTEKHRWYSDRKQSTIWEFDRPTKSKLHPTTKPVELVAYPIRNSSQVNGIVLDLFGGSGSTLIACEQIDRSAYVMELDPKYAAVIIKRYAEAAGDAKDVFVEREGGVFSLQEALAGLDGGQTLP